MYHKAYMCRGSHSHGYGRLQVKKKKGKKGAGGDGKRQVTNLREAPYSLKDGDVVALVDKEEDPEGSADLTRADDEVCGPDIQPRQSVPLVAVKQKTVAAYHVAVNQKTVADYHVEQKTVAAYQEFNP